MSEWIDTLFLTVASIVVVLVLMSLFVALVILSEGPERWKKVVASVGGVVMAILLLNTLVWAVTY